MSNNANDVILPLKVIFMILQFFLVGIILYTRDEYIYISITHNNRSGPESDEYNEAFILVLIASCIYFGLLLLELFTLSFGLSIMFQQVNSIQMLLHGMGMLGNIWMILDRWHWIQLYVLATLFALFPFLLELSVIFAARSQMKQMTLMKEKMQAAKPTISPEVYKKAEEQKQQQQQPQQQLPQQQPQAAQ